MGGKPGVELLQQLPTAGNVLQMKVEARGVAVFRPEHIDRALAAPFQPDAVQLAVAGGFDIQRDPLQRRAVVRAGLQAGIHQRAVARFAADPHRGGDKTLHQKTLRRADVGFVQGYAALAEQFLVAHQLAMGTAVEAVHRLAAEVFQLKRRQAVMAFTREDPLCLGHLRRGDKRHRLLHGQHHP